MYTGKGFPKHEKVEEFLLWDAWKVDGKFSIELPRAFSLMYAGKGFPKHGEVEEFLRWDAWKVDGMFCAKRLRTISSMYKGKGLPEYEKVKAILKIKTKPYSDCDNPAREKVKTAALDLTQKGINGTENDLEILKLTLRFDMNENETEAAKKLFEVINSRNIEIKPSFYKLLIINTDRDCFVKACTNAAVFFTYANDSIEDTGVITGMLQTKKHTKNFAGRAESELRYFAELDNLCSFSSMNNSRGLPKQVEVEEFLRWDAWIVDGEFSIERLRTFSSMYHSKGLPKQAQVQAILDWVTCGKVLNTLLLQLMVKLNASEAVPDIKKLESYEQKLQDLFFSGLTTRENSSGYESIAEENKNVFLIKQVALFLSTKKQKWSFSWEKLEQFYQEVLFKFR